MLYRKIQRHIETFLKSESNKVLIVDGARQIGKTFIIRHVGKATFENFIEVKQMYPLDFEEFLMANGFNSLAIRVLHGKFKNGKSLDVPMHNC